MDAIKSVGEPRQDKLTEAGGTELERIETI